MSNHMIDVMLKHKRVIIVTLAAVALASYMLPFESLFGNHHAAIAASGKYGRETPGKPTQNPGGGPKTPGGGGSVPPEPKPGRGPH